MSIKPNLIRETIIATAGKTRARNYTEEFANKSLISISTIITLDTVSITHVPVRNRS